jgi:hypothetical protein
LNGECGQISNLNFGNPVPSTTYDPDILRGWGKREYNWEGSVSVQHQVMQNVSVEAGYFRRWYGNFLATDNQLVSATDFETFSVAAPGDSRLPDGGGQRISGLYDVVPTRFGQTRNLLTFAENYGTQIENWQGFDVNVNANLGRMMVQGGLSTGRRLTDSCEIRAALPETAPLNPYCRVEEPYLTQLKALAAYTLPRVDVQLAATVQSIPGPVVSANVVYPSGVIAGTLLRPLAGNVATAVVNVIPTAAEYGDRLNQLDFRVGKIVRLVRARVALNVDLFNALNSNAVLTENASFGVFRQPLAVLNPRLVKFSANVDF